jgi:type II secretory pathway component GspD/PulD (secretin)
VEGDPARPTPELVDAARRRAEETGPPAIERNPYLVFGNRIRVHPDGTITKPFPLRYGTGKKMQNLLLEFGNFPLWTSEEPVASTAETIKLDLIEAHDVEVYQNLRDPAFPASEPVPLADWLIVTSGFDLLQEVEQFINLFAASVPQIEIEAKIVEITFTDSLDYGVKQISPTTPTFDFPGDHTFVKSFGYDLPNSTEITEGLLTLGGIADGLAFNAVLEAVASRDNVSIISQPKIAVREGGRADIVNNQRIPFLQISTINPSGGFNASLDYITVGISLFVVPRVVGTKTVALNIDIEASQQTGTVNTAVNTDPNSTTVVPSPVISTRSARTIVYLQPGQAVILGGLLTERSVENERKIPILGDIPLLGHLFKSTFLGKEQTNVLFFIRPRILQGSDLNREF